MRTQTLLALALLAAPAALPAQGITGAAAPGDTSHTLVDGGHALVHTVARTADAVESSLMRPDGVAGTARSEFDLDLPRSYTARFTRGAEAPLELRVRRRGARLEVTGTHAAVVPIPRNTRWAVADVGMDEHLVPALRTLPQGTAGMPLAVFRPSVQRWDQLHATVSSLAGATLIQVRDADGAVSLLLITDVGDLLYVETLAPRTGAVTSRRVPAAGSRRAERLEDLLALARSR